MEELCQWFRRCKGDLRFTYLSFTAEYLSRNSVLWWTIYVTWQRRDVIFIDGCFNHQKDIIILQVTITWPNVGRTDLVSYAGFVFREGTILWNHVDWLNVWILLENIATYFTGLIRITPHKLSTCIKVTWLWHTTYQRQEYEDVLDSDFQ